MIVPLTVTVKSVAKLDIQPTGPSVQEATTGDIIAQTFAVANMGNGPIRVNIDYDSEPVWATTLVPQDRRLSLAPGETGNVTLVRTIPETLPTALTFKLTVTAKSVDFTPPAQASASIKVQVTPRHLSGSEFPSLHGTAGVLFALPDDKVPSWLMSIGPLSGDLGNGREASVGVLNVLLAGQDHGTFVQDRRIWAQYADPKWGYAWLGDLFLDLDSPLMLRDMVGSGGDVLIHGRKGMFRAFSAQADSSDRRLDDGFQISCPATESVAFRLTALQDAGNKSYDDHTRLKSSNIGLATLLGPYHGAQMTGEYAWSDSLLHGVNHAFRVNGAYQIKRFSSNLEWLKADPNFSRDWDNKWLRRFNLQWNPVDEVGVWYHSNETQGKTTDDSSAGIQHFNDSDLGASWNVADSMRFRLSDRSTHGFDTASTGYDYLTRISSFTLTKTWDMLSVTAGYQHQKDDFALTDDQELTDSLLLDTSMRFSPIASVRMSYTGGGVSDKVDPSIRQRDNFALGSDFRLAENLGLALNAEQNTGSILGTRTDIYGTLKWEILQEHILNFRVRYFKDFSYDDTEVAFEYTQPFSLPLRMIRRTGSVEGKVFLEGNPDVPMDNVRLAIDGSSVMTDNLGHFVFPSLAPGDYKLTIDPTSVKVGTISTIDLPLLVTVKAGYRSTVNISMTRTASVGGRLMMDLPFSLKQPSTTPLTDIIVELHGPDGEITKLTDNYGYYVFTDLKPGKYTLILQEQSLPKGKQISGATQMEIDLGPGTSIRNLDFRVKAVEKPIEISEVGKGTDGK